METAARKTRVLVVDDQPIIAETLALILHQNGFDTQVAHSGQQAISTAHAFAPDVLITDVMMQGINGIDAASTIVSSFPLCQILLISGNPNTTNLLEAAHRQGHNFEILPKPVHPKDLLERLTTRPHHSPAQV